ncbi:MAG TPA: 4-hydroxy-3-methylbut-2-enyl diphosphate reductase, partial [Crocinitomicaceae bacterium]|nr:4-hydroxy-3-methylbut-2-enyl diphosphate reductase [Crocinitomicaceae bacterium]
VENAIEKSYAAINENPNKRIFLISQMIHNPDVNADLQSMGVRFIQDTDGSQLIPWNEITKEDIVIIPAFGTTIETEAIIRSKGLDVQKYNTTCPFVEKVWNRSAKLGESDHTIIIHGKHKHEETRATFSHSQVNSPSLIVKDIEEAKNVANYILGKTTIDQFLTAFKDKLSEGFDPNTHLKKIGVVNQTTMLASETQKIADFLKETMVTAFDEEHLSEHFADTRDTLCYATNDNQSATLELLKSEADIAIVVGGYNSSNTTHLVELLEPSFKTFFIRNEDEIKSKNEIHAFDIHSKSVKIHDDFIPQKDQLKIIITSGASCPDAVVDRVIQKIANLQGVQFDSQNLL